MVPSPVRAQGRRFEVMVASGENTVALSQLGVRPRPGPGRLNLTGRQNQG